MGAAKQRRFPGDKMRLINWLKAGKGRLAALIFVTAAILPLLVAGGFLAVASLQAAPALRYDPAYFAEPYLSRYDSPRAVLEVLEQQVFKTGDLALTAEIQGLRRAYPLPHNARLFGGVAWQFDDPFLAYLFWDYQTYERYPVYVEEVNGRWVLVPPDAVFYWRTGLWQRAWLPVALPWWMAVLVALLMFGLSRLADKWRRNPLAF